MPTPLSRTLISTSSSRWRVDTVKVSPEIRFGPIALPLGRGIKAVAEQIEKHPCDLLRGQFDRRKIAGELALQTEGIRGHQTHGLNQGWDGHSMTSSTRGIRDRLSRASRHFVVYGSAAIESR